MARHASEGDKVMRLHAQTAVVENGFGGPPRRHTGAKPGARKSGFDPLLMGWTGAPGDRQEVRGESPLR